MPNAAHLHLILNHFPIIGTAITVLVLGYGLMINNDHIKRLGMFLIILLALVTIPVFATGDEADGFIKGQEGVLEENIEPHEEFAEKSVIAMYITGGIALIGLLIFRKTKPVPMWFGLVLLGFLIVVNMMMIYTGHLGGKISHSEIMTHF